MVKICTNNYNNLEYESHFNIFPYELSDFQKYAIEAIVTGNHVITTAHTGSGKTVPAIFAIKYFLEQGKKVIYTSPIKALSNQKFNEFKSLTDNIGILTGDIKINPEGNLLIMTTEILCNTLYFKKNNMNKILDFNMDFENELACVIFDEIHYLNDPERGRVWEESIMMLPLNVQIVGLSATIDNPDGFCQWIENKYTNNKQVYLASTTQRIVPLTHYMFLTANDFIQNRKQISKEDKQTIKNNTNKLFIIQDSKGNFNSNNYKLINDTHTIIKNNNIFIKPAFVLNQVCKYLVETEDNEGKNMLPALCFVLSRKKLEEYANQITISLLPFDSKVPYIIKKECDSILRNRLPNYEEYLNLPEYVNMVKLLEKGIAIHHSGCLPVLKEIVEILYDKGYIKLLFATETFSIGINMPTKTVIFTDLNKFDGSIKRNLYSHEYTQMAGRAGRRGIDKVGNVIHLNNLFTIDSISYKKILSGIPQKLTSKFKISYNLLLNHIQSNTSDILSYVKKSMINENIENDINVLNNQIIKIKDSINEIITMTPIDIIDNYLELSTKLESTTNGNQRKKLVRQLDDIKESHKFLTKDIEIILSNKKKLKDIQILEEEINNTNNFFINNINYIYSFLKDEGFINEDNTLTLKGQYGSIIKEVNCLVFSKLIFNNTLNNLTPIQLVGLFSCFTEIRVSSDLKQNDPSNCSYDEDLNLLITNIFKEYEYYEQKEFYTTGLKYNKHVDIINESINWCNCTNYDECCQIIKLLENKNIFLGEFCKALLKINNIADELIKLSKFTNNIELENKLSQIRDLTLKYIICNQSLYV
jgi:superfamily II RNA helicase